MKALTKSDLQLLQHPHDRIKIWLLGNRHIIMTVAAFLGHVITIYNFPKSDKQSQKPDLLNNHNSLNEHGKKIIKSA